MFENDTRTQTKGLNKPLALESCNATTFGKDVGISAIIASLCKEEGKRDRLFFLSFLYRNQPSEPNMNKAFATRHSQG